MDERVQTVLQSRSGWSMASVVRALVRRVANHRVKYRLKTSACLIGMPWCGGTLVPAVGLLGSAWWAEMMTFPHPRPMRCPRPLCWLSTACSVNQRVI